jgi:translation initiation factor IF-1
LAKDDLAKVEGIITKATGGGNYIITLDSGATVTAKLSGAMKRYKVRVLPGDRVTVGVSLYDPSHGLIVYRHKA